MMRSLLAATLLALGACGTDPALRSASSPSATMSATADEAAFPNVVTRRVFAAGLYGHPVFSQFGVEGSLSPDGRTLLNDNGAFDLLSGERASPELRGELFSRDGSRVASIQDGQLAIRGIDGTRSRTVALPDHLDVHRALILEDWSPDGQTLVAVGYGRDRRQQILLLSADDGSSRVLESVGWAEPYAARFSPDGRLIAYTMSPADGAEPEVFVIAVDGSRKTQLTSAGPAKQVVGWSNRGDALFYWEWSRDGMGSVWRTPMRGETAAGPAQRVRGDLVESHPIQVVDDRIYYRTDVGVSSERMFEVALDSEGGAGSAPRLASPPRLGDVRSTAPAPDGARVAYLVRTVAPGSHEGRGTPPFIVMRTVATGAEHEIAPALGSITRITRWSDDGESLLLEGQREGVYGMYRFDLASGRLSLVAALPLPSAHGTGVNYVASSGDGSVLYFVVRERGPDGVTVKLVAHDTHTGSERLVLTEAPGRTLEGAIATLSPNGEYLALYGFDAVDQDYRYQEVRIVPTAGGPSRTLFRANPDLQLETTATPWGRPAWSPDGAYLYVATNSPDPQGRRAERSPLGPRRIWRVPVDGGEPSVVVTLENSVLPILSLSVGPDGRRLYYSGGGGSPDATGEIWVMENLEPAVGATPAAGR